MSLESVSAEMVILEPTVKLVGVFSSLHSIFIHVLVTLALILSCFSCVSFSCFHTSIPMCPDLIPCQRGSPCSQGVICSNDGVGGYICHCQVGYSGPACEYEIDECDPNPCYNGSTCIVSIQQNT